MDDLYSFGKTKYIPAEPLPRSNFRLVTNVLSVWYLVVKCTVLGILLTIKKLLFDVSPRKSSKNIQHQVALVGISIKTIFFSHYSLIIDLNLMCVEKIRLLAAQMDSVEL